MKKVLITESEGNIGKTIIKFLEKDYKIERLDKKLGKDITNKKVFEEAFARNDVIIHLAREADIIRKTPKPHLDNYNFSVKDFVIMNNLLHSIRKYPNKKIIFASSIHTHSLFYIRKGEEIIIYTSSVYGMVKHFIENLLCILSKDNFCRTFVIRIG